ncbi:hypothetical protein GJV26_05530 [Massilia dura]|uniref:Uncharacterized protein n=1 Tax=Pseudoduganella dura TaxID=321982 RepID=A0A6I3XF99_9BURK|nr:hypothetical protein [Pseudoduganella dura]MUI11942.1 hypothetical protein [Pseudoduganella dura]GGY13659.1 hypothetical protein GCM10007386_49940 [Pseudoduganella dura]
MRSNDHFNSNHGFNPYSSSGYVSGNVQFTITDGQVTGLARVAGDHVIPVKLPADATFTVGTGTVTETITRGTTTEVSTYAVDTADSTLYHLSQDVKTFDTTVASARSYTFTVTDGSVTAVSESVGWSGNVRTVDVTKLAATSFTVEGGTITATTVHGNTLETLQFTSTDGTTYHLASDTQAFAALGSATTALDVDPYDRLSFTFSGDTVTAAQVVKADGTTVAVSTHGNTTVAYTQPEEGYVVQTVTYGTRTQFEVFHDGNGDGIYTEVAHGTGATVDIVGLQAQITTAIDALL